MQLQVKKAAKRQTILVQSRFPKDLFIKVREASAIEGLGLAAYVRRLCAVAVEARRKQSAQ